MNFEEVTKDWKNLIIFKSMVKFFAEIQLSWRFCFILSLKFQLFWKEIKLFLWIQLFLNVK